MIKLKKENQESHTISIKLSNESGALARVIGLFSGRGYNIESLNVAEIDEDSHKSRRTIVTNGSLMSTVIVVVVGNASFLRCKRREKKKCSRNF